VLGVDKEFQLFIPSGHKWWPLLGVQFDCGVEQMATEGKTCTMLNQWRYLAYLSEHSCLLRNALDSGGGIYSRSQ